MRPVPPPRRLWAIVFRNFVRSFAPSYRNTINEGTGSYIGSDHLGTKYFEKKAEPDRGRRIPTRYFEVADPANYCRENLPPEWDSWLRQRRATPPTEEEAQRNMQIARMKKINAAVLEAKQGKHLLPELQVHSSSGKFPSFDEYESNPGQEPRKEDT